MSIRKIIVMIVMLVLALTTVSYASYQFRLCGVTVVKTTTSKHGPVLLSICLRHVTDLFLKNVKIYVYVFGDSTITPLPITYTLVLPYQQLRFNVLVNASVNRWHLINIEVWWEEELVSKKTIYGFVPEGAFSLTPSTQYLNATVYFPGEPELNVQVKPTVLSPSSTYIMDVNICNVGSGTMYNVRVSMDLVPSSTYIVVENTRNLTLSINKLEPGRCILDRLKVTSGSTLGLVELRLDATYVDAIGNIGRLVKTYPIEVTYSGSVQVIPEKLYLQAGERNSAIIDICNRYGSAIRDVKLTVRSVVGALLLNTTSIDVGNVDAHTCKPLRLSIIVPKTPETMRGVTLSYDLSYKIPPNILVTKYGSVTWSIVAEPVLTITQITTAPKHPTVGEAVIISVIAENLGEAPAYDLNITVVPGPGLKPVSSTYSFYPRLNAYSQIPASFTLNVTKSGELRCRIVVTYVDPYGVHHKVERTVIIRALSLTGAGLLSSPSPSGYRLNMGGEASLSYLPYVVVAVVAVIVVVSIAVACRRRRRSS
ncbi:MAG: hypothetical protein GXO23_01750 [Crenarchaeota archaeon]|nr:hypothetical protein [Thermoproteota archaeon]